MRICPDCGLSFRDPGTVQEKDSPFVCTSCLDKASPRPTEGWPIESRWISGTKGRGVFATRDVSKGETLERCWVMPLSEEESKASLSLPTLNRYLFPWEKGRRAIVSGDGLLYNYDSLSATRKQPNTECVLRRGISAIEFRALRDIRRGEELTWDYKKAMLRRA